MKQVLKNHPNCIILMMPKLRDAVSGRPKSFQVLQTCLTTEAAEKALDYYEAEGFDGVVALPNFSEGCKAPELPPERVAKLFRVLYGRE